MSRSLEADIVIGALKNAINSRYVRRGAIIHTDQGSQYVDNDYKALLAKHGLKQSMSARGNCYENAQAESFFARFKTELLEGGVFENFDQAVSETRCYIDGYYNIHRRHSGIGYMTPAEYELEKKTKQSKHPKPSKKRAQRSTALLKNKSKKEGKRVRIVSEII